MKYKFEIGAYTPATMPMARLAEYMADLAKLLGEREHVHFETVEEGCTIPVARVDREAEPKVMARLRSVGRDDAPADVTSAYLSLNKLLASDNASGRLYIEKTGKLKTNIVMFPGINRQSVQQIVTSKEHGSIDGIVVRIGGEDGTAHIKLVDGETSYSSVEVGRTLARDIAAHLYGSPVRLYGDITWRRIDGSWRLDKMKVTSFDVLNAAPLDEVVAALRAVEGSGWKSMTDPLLYLKELRE